VVVPETLRGRSVLQFAGRRSPFWLKASLLFEPGIVVADVPLMATSGTSVPAPADRPLAPGHHVVVVPVSSVNDASFRAIQFAKSLRPEAVHGVFFAFDPEDVATIQEQWAEWRVDVALTIVDAPFRDIRIPLLDEVRRYTQQGNTVVTVVLPELVVERWWQVFLHNQVGLYIKRTLVFEPQVVVTSVPSHLGSERRPSPVPA